MSDRHRDILEGSRCDWWGRGHHQVPVLDGKVCRDPGGGWGGRKEWRYCDLNIVMINSHNSMMSYQSLDVTIIITGIALQMIIYLYS